MIFKIRRSVFADGLGFTEIHTCITSPPPPPPAPLEVYRVKSGSRHELCGFWMKNQSHDGMRLIHE